MRPVHIASTIATNKICASERPIHPLYSLVCPVPHFASKKNLSLGRGSGFALFW